jgi:predicted ATP-dependent endonuclease of OLD family
LIEEPEVHLHPALEFAMLTYLRNVSSKCQVFLSTHSTNFLDTSDIGNVYLITKQPTGATECKRIAPSEYVEEIPRELGLRLSSLFMFDRLVFVEGATDEELLRSWASIVKANFAANNVGFVIMGGRTKLHAFCN